MNDLSQFKEDFIKNYDNNSHVGYFLEVDVEYPKNYLIFSKICWFYRKERKLKNVANLFVMYKTKNTTLFTQEP